MAGRKLGILGAVAALAAAPFLTAGLGAQETASSRFRVLVPDFQPAGDEDDDFGKDLAEELREAISQLNTHTAVDKDDIEDALDRFKLKMRDLDCIRSRQLAAQSNFEVVLCATYAQSGAGIEVSGIQFVDARTGEAFLVDPIMSARKQEKQAAAQIVSEFELFVEQTRRARFCSDYAQSQQWDQSLDNCDRALDLNPEANSVRYTRASVLRNLERWEEALQEIDRVLEADPFHENALQLGGYVARQLEQPQLALTYYRRQLELDPGNAQIRMNIAYNVAQEGDPLPAMLLIEDGIEIDPENINFYNQHGNFAFAAARKIADRNRATGAEEITPEVAELYRKAIASYQRVMESPENEIQPGQVRNAAVAYLQLGETQASADFSAQALERFPEDESIWMIHADALRALGQADEALDALQQVERINPQARQLHLRMADLLIQAGRYQEAVPVLQQAVQNDTPADQAANMIFSTAYSRFMQPTPKNYKRFMEVMQLTESFDVSDMARQTYDFWYGWAIYNQAIADQEPSTLETARATLPRFQEALALFQSSKDYMDTQPTINYGEVIESTGVYIEIQEAIIKRGR